MPSRKLLAASGSPFWQPSEVPEPREQALDAPAALQPSRRSAVLRLDPTAFAVRRDDLDVAVVEKSRVEPVAVVRLVADEALGPAFARDALEDVVNEGDFGG